MSDTIDRQAAIDELIAMRKHIESRMSVIGCTAYEMAIEALREPERKKGKWGRNFDGNEWYWFCSNCKEEWHEEDLWMGGNDFPNFCPNCGADMRGEADG